MTASDLTSPDHVVIECPKCGAREAAEPGVLTDAPMIVCRECGETWPSAPRRRVRRLDLVDDTRARIKSNFVEAERRPLVTYSNGTERAWAAKAEGDYWPAPPRPRRLPMIAGGFAAALFLAAFFGARDQAVNALPDLAGLYAAIGLPVHVDGIAIENVIADRASDSGGERIVVRGTIRNVGKRERALQPLAAILYDSGKVPARVEGFDPPARTIGAGQSAPFILKLHGTPPQVREVAVRFRRPGEGLAPGGTTPAAATR